MIRHDDDVEVEYRRGDTLVSVDADRTLTTYSEPREMRISKPPEVTIRLVERDGAEQLVQREAFYLNANRPTLWVYGKAYRKIETTSAGDGGGVRATFRACHPTTARILEYREYRSRWPKSLDPARLR